MRTGLLLCAVAYVALGLASAALAQLPAAQLTSVFPPGGERGKTVSVTIAGSDLEDVERLVWNHPGLTAQARTSSATPLEPARPKPNEFDVAIAGDVPCGIYEVRALGRFGLSNPRSFVVGERNELTDAAGNSTPEKALDVSPGTTINGRLEANTYDYFRLPLKQGERVSIEIAAH